MEKKLRKYGKLLEGWKKGSFSSGVGDDTTPQVRGMDLSSQVQDKENLQEFVLTENAVTSREPFSFASGMFSREIFGDVTRAVDV